VHTAIDEIDPAPLVLVAEDDARLASFLHRVLATAGYRVEHSSQPAQFMTRVRPDLILLDPGQASPEPLVRELRTRTDAPIVILSAMDSAAERVAGLDAGADDFLSIPFSLEELLARLRALRRGRALASASAQARARHGTLRYADVCLDLDTREVTRGSRKIELRNKGFELLVCFLRHADRVLSRRELLEEVWGFEFLGDSNVIEVTVSHVRQALEAEGEPRLIFTVRPVGYILSVRASMAQGTATG
jgi:two-component system response regulator MprA